METDLFRRVHVSRFACTLEAQIEYLLHFLQVKSVSISIRCSSCTILIAYDSKALVYCYQRIC